MKTVEEYVRLAENYCDAASDYSANTIGGDMALAEIRVNQAQMYAQLALVAVALRMEENSVQE